MLCTIKKRDLIANHSLMRDTMHPRLSLRLLLLLLSGLGLRAHGGEIINGEKAPEGEMLYMASLQNAARRHICGGFLISEDVVVTAAHCEEDDDDMLKSVVLGTHDLVKIDEEKMRYNIETKCKHKDFNNNTLVNDIMLLKLSSKVQLEKQRFKIINVPKTEVKLNDRDICQVAGWGITQQCACSVTQLQKVDVRFLNLDKCRKKWRKPFPDTVMCAGGFTRDGHGFCQGDSGGPLVCKGVPVGIVSFNKRGHDKRGNCSYPNFPNVYTNLLKYIDWIDETKKKRKC